MTLNKKLLILIMALSFSSSFAQTQKPMQTNSNPAQTSPPPGNIKILPGYVLIWQRGIDTVIGKIRKEKGMEIFYDIGAMAGNDARGALDKKENVLWSKEQEINNKRFLIVCLKDGSIYVNVNSFANFRSVVKSDEDLADFLLMITTYGYSDVLPGAKIPKPE